MKNEGKMGKMGGNEGKMKGKTRTNGTKLKGNEIY